MVLIDNTINFSQILSETPDTDFLSALSEKYNPIIRLRQLFVLLEDEEHKESLNNRSSILYILLFTK